MLYGTGPPLSPQTAIWAGVFRLPGKVHPGEGGQSSVPFRMEGVGAILYSWQLGSQQ